MRRPRSSGDGKRVTGRAGHPIRARPVVRHLEELTYSATTPSRPEHHRDVLRARFSDRLPGRAAERPLVGQEAATTKRNRYDRVSSTRSTTRSSSSPSQLVRQSVRIPMLPVDGQPALGVFNREVGVADRPIGPGVCVLGVLHTLPNSRSAMMTSDFDRTASPRRALWNEVTSRRVRDPSDA